MDAEILSDDQIRLLGEENGSVAGVLESIGAPPRRSIVTDHANGKVPYPRSFGQAGRIRWFGLAFRGWIRRHSVCGVRNLVLELNSNL